MLATHFFLDCFRAEQLAMIVPRLAKAATANARWLLADFREPAAGFAKWRAKWILRIMHLFFQRVVHLSAAELTPPDPYLQDTGFTLRERRLFEWGLLHGDLWERA